jgi:hypothetical protein
MNSTCSDGIRISFITTMESFFCPLTLPDNLEQIFRYLSQHLLPLLFETFPPIPSTHSEILI